MRVLCFVAILLLAGCASDSDDPDPEPTPTSDPTPDDDQGPAPKTWDLEISDNEYPDGSITIQVGDTVRWTNTGGNPHTVTADGGSFDSGSDQDDWLRNGDTFVHTFTEAGEFPYHCVVHPSMRATVTVTIP